MNFDPGRSVLAIGTVFHGRYEVVRCLKHGGMGAIYEVVHIETRRRRALKLMLPTLVTNVDMHARFKLEATVAADIESEHIVETFDAGIDGETGVPFLVMELLRGEDLDTTCQKRGALPPNEVVLMLAQTASALDKTHAAGVVHRDLKPENLFVARRDDGTPKIKILDFGIAKVVSESGQPAAKTKVLGTPLYMSPEQIRGDGTIGPRADLYALTHIAFTLLTGHAFWEDSAQSEQMYAMLMRIVAGSPVSASTVAAKHGVELPPGFDAWFKRGTAIIAGERFSTASELVEALAAVFDVPVTRSSTVELPAPLKREVPSPLTAPSPRAEPAPVATRLLPESPMLAAPRAVNATSTSASMAAGMSQPIPPLPVRSSKVGAIVGAVIAVAIAGVIASRMFGQAGPASSAAASAPRIDPWPTAPPSTETAQEAAASAASASAPPPEAATEADSEPTATAEDSARPSPRAPAAREREAGQRARSKGGASAKEPAPTTSARKRSMD